MYPDDDQAERRDYREHHHHATCSNRNLVGVRDFPAASLPRVGATNSGGHASGYRAGERRRLDRTGNLDSPGHACWRNRDEIPSTQLNYLCRNVGQCHNGLAKEEGMNQSSYLRTLLSERRRWEGVALNSIDQAPTDAQSNSMLRTAMSRQAAIDSALKRIAEGTFGFCSGCGQEIEAERLDLLLDSDCHTCAACARAANTSKKPYSAREQRRSLKLQQHSNAWTTARGQ